MMAVQQVFSLFCDAWTLYRSFADRKLTEQEREDFINRAGMLMRKYEKAQLAIDVIAAVFNEINRIDKKNILEEKES